MPGVLWAPATGRWACYCRCGARGRERERERERMRGAAKKRKTTFDSMQKCERRVCLSASAVVVGVQDAFVLATGRAVGCAACRADGGESLERRIQSDSRGKRSHCQFSRLCWRIQSSILLTSRLCKSASLWSGSMSFWPRCSKAAVMLAMVTRALSISATSPACQAQSKNSWPERVAAAAP